MFTGHIRKPDQTAIDFGDDYQWKLNSWDWRSAPGEGVATRKEKGAELYLLHTRFGELPRPFKLTFPLPESLDSL